MSLPRLAIFYKPSQGLKVVTIDVLHQNSWQWMQNYKNTHDYAEYSDFYYDFQILLLFSNFRNFWRFFQSCSKHPKNENFRFLGPKTHFFKNGLVQGGKIAFFRILGIFGENFKVAQNILKTSFLGLQGLKRIFSKMALFQGQKLHFFEFWAFLAKISKVLKTS